MIFMFDIYKQCLFVFQPLADQNSMKSVLFFPQILFLFFWVLLIFNLTYANFTSTQYVQQGIFGL